jgi:hypothetical protein
MSWLSFKQLFPKEFKPKLQGSILFLQMSRPSIILWSMEHPRFTKVILEYGSTCTCTLFVLSLSNFPWKEPNSALDLYYHGKNTTEPPAGYIYDKMLFFVRVPCSTGFSKLLNWFMSNYLGNLYYINMKPVKISETC